MQVSARCVPGDTSSSREPGFVKLLERYPNDPTAALFQVLGGRWFGLSGQLKHSHAVPQYVQWLKDAGALVHSVNNHGETPLHVALRQYNHIPVKVVHAVALLLLESKANPDAPDYWNMQSCVQLAVQTGDVHLLQLVLRYSEYANRVKYSVDVEEVSRRLVREYDVDLRSAQVVSVLLQAGCTGVGHLTRYLPDRERGQGNYLATRIKVLGGLLAMGVLHAHQENFADEELQSLLYFGLYSGNRPLVQRVLRWEVQRYIPATRFWRLYNMLPKFLRWAAFKLNDSSAVRLLMVEWSRVSCECDMADDGLMEVALALFTCLSQVLEERRKVLIAPAIGTTDTHAVQHMPSSWWEQDPRVLRILHHICHILTQMQEHNMAHLREQLTSLLATVQEPGLRQLLDIMTNKVAWSRQVHGSFPKTYHAAVQTVLLAANRGRFTANAAVPGLHSLDNNCLDLIFHHMTQPVWHWLPE